MCRFMLTTLCSRLEHVVPVIVTIVFPWF
jgi:hypothetical protein